MRKGGTAVHGRPLIVLDHVRVFILTRKFRGGPGAFRPPPDRYSYAPISQAEPTGLKILSRSAVK